MREGRMPHGWWILPAAALGAGLIAMAVLALALPG